MAKTITTPLDEKTARSLKAGDRVLIDGVIYTGRDAAHARLLEMAKKGEPWPLDLQDQIIYYVGPCPEKPGQVIGPAGPTTSGRMDLFTPALLEKGLRGMIGKGSRSPQVVETMKKVGAVYFVATGGAAALIADRITASELVAFGELGTEAIRRLVVKEFPVIVALDSDGNDLYKIGREKFRVAV
ncbi:MAG: Fe-S-containing hydro-lyase [Firmicutes bacterium]|nr:Fe-S-containing hydro-lyase [Bacillota bacterium]